MEQHLNWRYATKKFDPAKKLSDQELKRLLNVLRLSPSSFGLQPWKFIVITDPQLRKELRKAAWDQPQITDASCLIVLCVKTDMDALYIQDFVKRIAKVRKIQPETLNAYQDMMLGFLKALRADEVSHWMTKQVYIALGVLLNECAHLRIDACPMEGFDASKFDEILKLKQIGLHSAVLCSVGYRAADDMYANLPKVRFEEHEVVITR